ncbi:hypothetical protein Q3A80_12475 [Burkholderia sp. SR8]|jgi:hypothetical protein|uniref:hypothetical protein n=1 Tax=Burkholderia sp. SR8 TaxID=3062277 RepID=UPI004063655F
MDSNSVTLSIDSPYTISSINYIDNSLVVSANQNHDPAPEIPPPVNNVWTLTLNSDRDNTSPVATSFNNIAGGASHAYTPLNWSLGGAPGALNFYFGVNISIGSETIVVYLGQGQWGAAHYNWWIGSSALVIQSYLIPGNGEQPPMLGFAPQMEVDGTRFALQGKSDSSFHLSV